MKDKFVLVRTGAAQTERPVIRVEADVYKQLVNASAQSRQSIAQVASQAIRFAFENVEYVDMD